jgi:hypothetical protein
VTEVDSEDIRVLVETIFSTIDQFMEEHPEVPVDTVATAVSFIHGAMFRLASEIPPSKLH